MLDLSLDPSAAGVLDPGRGAAGEAPFLSELGLAALASNSLRNCSLFMVVAGDEFGFGADLERSGSALERKAKVRYLEQPVQITIRYCQALRAKSGPL
jgi:hypothetical protein